jgi:hypothetical protein
MFIKTYIQKEEREKLKIKNKMEKYIKKRKKV